MRGRTLMIIAALAILGILALQPAVLRAQPPQDAPVAALPAPWSHGEPMAGVTAGESVDEGGPGYVPNRLLVRFEPGTTEERRAELHARYGAQVVDEIPALGVEVLQLYDDSVSMVSAYQANSEVTYAEPDYLVSIAQDVAIEAAPRPARLTLRTPNDPLFSQQWHHETINSSQAWDYSIGDNTTVAIIDTGVNCAHPDLSGKCVSGYDFINRDNDPADDHGHGTHVAGIAAAATNNGVGVASTGWNAMIMPMKALDATGNGGHSALASAITWSVDSGADVINMSLGGFFTSSTLRNAIDYAIDRDVTVLAASGNENTSNPSYPSAYPGVIAVAATTPSDTRASFSNYGNHIDISAPGVAIMSTVRQGGYQSWNGTSMATPVASGVAALLLAQDPSRSPARIEEILESTAVDLGAPGWDQLYGYGRIDAGAALAFDTGGGSPTATPTDALPTPTQGPPTVTPTPASDFVQQVEDLINLERASRSKPPLLTHLALRQASARHTADLATNVLCQHGGTDGSTPGSRMRDAGYPDPFGEIVACGQTSPASVVNAWMMSEPHRNVILCDTCTELGAGYSFSGGGFVHYWTVTFGARDVAGQPTPTLAAPTTPEPTLTAAPTQTPQPATPTPTDLPGSFGVILTPAANRIGWVVSTEPYGNHFVSADTYTGTWDNKTYHGAMQFDLDPIPRGAHVNFARLEAIGRSAQFLGTSGTWMFQLLATAIDDGFESHGFAAIDNATVDAMLLPQLGVIQLGAGTVNTFNFEEGDLAIVQSRVNGSRKLSLRIDGPSSGPGSNLFTWDTGYTAESYYLGPQLTVNYSLQAPTAPPTETSTPEPEPSEPPTQTPTATDGPTATATDTQEPPTATLTPIPPTATDTPPPPPPTRTPTSTAVPSPDAPVEFVPEAGDVGWVRQYEPGNHFGDDSILAGVFDGLVYIGGLQFDISSIPDGSEIQSAQLVLTGQSGRNLASLGNGLWRVKLLQTDADAGWRSHSFPSLSSARVFAQLNPNLRQYDLGVGVRNTFVFDDVLLRELEWRVATSGKVSFRIDGPRTGSQNVFDWESGYGIGSQNPPVLSIVYGPSNGNEPRPTEIPERQERIDEIVDLINDARVDAGLDRLTVHDSLRRAAEVHNFDMTFHDFFSHTGSDGSSPAQRVARTGYDAAAVGEILAARSSDPYAVMDAWMARAQRDVLMSEEYTEIGADYTQYLGASYNHYWTVVFARPVTSP